MINCYFFKPYFCHLVTKKHNWCYVKWVFTKFPCRSSRVHLVERGCSRLSKWSLVTLPLWCDYIFKEAKGHPNIPQQQQKKQWHDVYAQTSETPWSHTELSTLSVIADMGLFWLTLCRADEVVGNRMEVYLLRLDFDFVTRLVSIETNSS